MKNAFTLAEVLITLGIIGVVAAITMPTLLNEKRNKELETALKKNASVIGQAILMINQEEGLEVSRFTVGPREFKPKLIKQMKVIKDMRIILNTVIESFNYKTFNRTSKVYVSLLDDGQFILNDGTTVFIENSTIPQSPIYITIDVNGYKKGPNLWGHDLFTFDLIDNGKLLPMGAEGTHYANDNLYCSKTSTSNLNGIGCTYKALYEKDYFKNLP